MPFVAAKAIAATFCWKIRYALTPIFGVEFLSLCIPPDDVRFGRMIINPSIVRDATVTANQYRDQEIARARMASIPSTGGATYDHITARSGQRTSVKKLRPKPTSSVHVEEVDSEIENDTDTSEKYRYSPSVLPNSGWTPANTPRAPRTRAIRHGAIAAKRPLLPSSKPHNSNSSSSKDTLPSPQEILTSLSRLRRTPRARRGNYPETDDGTEPENGDNELRSVNSTGSTPAADPPYSPPAYQANAYANANAHISETENNPDIDGRFLLSGSAMNPPPVGQGRHSPLPLTNDARAAYMLMKLHMQEVVHSEENQSRKRRRASA